MTKERQPVVQEQTFSDLQLAAIKLLESIENDRIKAGFVAYARGLPMRVVNAKLEGTGWDYDSVEAFARRELHDSQRT